MCTETQSEGQIELYTHTHCLLFPGVLVMNMEELEQKAQ